MKFKLIIITLLLTCNCFAHRYKTVSEVYGNVKTYMRTGFEYSDINKIKIVGQLSEKLSKQLQYKDTILIEYIQNFRYVEDVYMLESNNSNYKFIDGLKSKYRIKSNHSGLAVRIYARQINIVDVLRLVEFTIKNQETVNEYLVKKRIVHKPYKPTKTLMTSVTDIELINKAISSKSKVIDEIINNKILVKGQDYYGVEIYWQNDKFIFEYNHSDKQEFIFELKDYFYHKYVNVNDVVIFVDKNSFYFIEGTHDKEKKLIWIDNESIAPLNVLDFGDKLLFYPYMERSKLSVFLKEKNKVISKFE